MYNDCSATFSNPRCLASVDTDTVHVVELSETFAVDFNALYETARTMRVSYGGTAPAEGVRHMLREGATIRDTGFAEVRFTPTRVMSGGTYTLSATFTGSDGPAATCSVRVRVPAQPPPTSAPPTPQPPPPTGNCVVSKEFGFDSEEELRSAGGHVALSTQTKHSGAGSMMMKVKDRSSFFRFETLQPARFSVYGRVDLKDTELTFTLSAPGQGVVNIAIAGDGRLHHNRLGRGWSRWVTPDSDVVRLGVFHHIVVAFDWDSRTSSVSIDGKQVGGVEPMPATFNGIDSVEVNIGRWGSAPAYVDEMELLCS